MEKSYYRQLTVIAVIGLVLAALVGVIFGIFFRLQITSQQFKFFNTAVSYVQTELDTAVYAQEVALKDFDGSARLASSYDLSGNITAEGVATIYSKTSVTSSVDEGRLNNIEKLVATSTVTSPADMFKNRSNRTAYLTSVKKAADGSYTFLMQDMSALINRFECYDFTNIYVLSSDGALLYAKVATDGTNVDFINRADTLVKNEWNRGSNTSFETTLDNKQVALSFAAPSAKTSLRIGGYLPFTAVNEIIKTYIAIHTAELALAFVLFSAICALILLTYRKKHNLMGFTPYVYSYIIKISKLGKIIAVSKPFKNNFDTRTVTFDLMALKDSTDPEKSGRPVVVDIMDKLGRIHHFVFSVLWSLRGYKLAGCDATETINEYRRLRTADMVDSATGLAQQKQFDKLIDNLSVQGKGIVGTMALIRASNLDKLRIMMGKNFFFSAITVFADTVKNNWSKFGEIFYTQGNDIIFFTTSQDSTKKILDSIVTVMGNCNRPVRIKENLMQLGIKAGITLVDTGKKPVTSANLIATCQSALDNAVNTINSDHYIMRSASFDESKTDFTAPGLVERMVANGEIDVYYQPQYDLKQKKIVAFEALCRIVGNKAKEIGVQQFINIAETYGGMVELGRFIYNKAMDFAKEVQDFGICVSVNVSPLQLMQMGFTEKFIDAFDQHGLKPNSLAIEITETTMVYSFADVETKLNLLHSKGIYTHIDDFGVAYSSMIYLKKLPISTLKIDKSLIDDICESKEGTAIVRNIINLTKDLGFESIAEAVETEDQRDILTQLGCDLIQGFLIGRAVPQTIAYDLIKEQS